MPELPEVEATVQYIRPYLEGKVIQGVDRNRDKLRKDIPDLSPIAGQKVKRIWRKGKLIIMDIGEDSHLLVHLGMSGCFRVYDGFPEAGKHDHVVIRTRDATIAYNDTRRFGMVDLVTNHHDFVNHPAYSELGYDGLDRTVITTAMLKFLWNTRHGKPVKVVMLDQSLIAGLGNIYASEVCHRAGVLPNRNVETLTDAELTLMAQWIPDIFDLAISNRGTGLSRYANKFQIPDPIGANYEQFLRVYDLEGKDCQTCGKGKIMKDNLGGRSTYWCPSCQK